MQTISTFLQKQRAHLGFQDQISSEAARMEMNPVLTTYLDEVLYYLDQVSRELNHIGDSFSSLHRFEQDMPKFMTYLPLEIYTAFMSMDLTSSVSIFNKYIESIRKLATEGKQINVIEDEVATTQFDMVAMIQKVVNKIKTQTQIE